MAKPIKLIKNRSDIGAGTRGADMGIDAIEIAAINRGSQFFNNFPFVDVETRNDVIYQKDRYPFAKRIDQVTLQCQRLSAAVQETMAADYFPLVLSGDHSSALGTIAGIKAKFPTQELGVIWIDAHADIHSPYTTPSGNMHGMPLAAALQQDNLQRQINSLDKETIEKWEAFKKLVTGNEAKLKPENLIYFGVRDTERQENELLEQLQIKNYTVETLRSNGIAASVCAALESLADCELIYLSFDVDVMDSEKVSDGTGTPVPSGLIKTEVKALLKEILNSEKVACVEVVEVNPLLDSKGNRMAETAFEILEEMTNELLSLGN